MVTLGAQTSGEDDRTAQPVLELRRLLATHCKGPYCQNVDEFALILRIGGDMNEFDFEGCQRLRRNRKGRYVTVDLGFPSRRWKAVSEEHLREFLVESTGQGLLCCLRRLEKDGEQVDSAKLLRDFAHAQMDFLSRGTTQRLPGEG